MPSPITPEETIVLSPFTVDASAEKGYLATQTLSGTRLKTDLKDIGAALTIFTEEMLDDLGATNLNDILAFAPNTDAFVNTLSDVSGNGNDFINLDTQYVTRGGRTSVVGQDFFANNIPGDRYNSEAFTFSRGPNAILFGLGNPAGAFVSSTKRAKNRTATALELKTDDRESLRTTVDHNQVIKKDLLAIRYAGLNEKNRGFRLPSESFQRRHYLTARFTPFQMTAIRVNYEQGFLKLPAIRPWPAYDAVSPWLASGSPLLATYTNVAAKPAGIANYSTAGLVSTQFSTGGVQIPTQKLQNQGITPVANYVNGFPASSGKRSFINPAIYPTFASAHGMTSYRQTDFKNYSAFIEQQITRDLFIEAGVNKVIADVYAVNGFVGDLDILYVDVNQQLPGGVPNPNVGKLYTESRTTVLVTPNESLSKRIMASYELDLTRQGSSWLRHLGRHRAAVFAEESDRKSYSSNLQAYNTTPFATTGAAATITNGANAIWYRYYYDPAAGKVGNTGGHFAAYPLIFANTPLPPPNPSGFTPTYVSQQGPNASDANIQTRAFALQSTFLQGRLVLTTGLRHDAQKAWRGIPDDFTANRDARGFAVDPSDFDLRKFLPNSLRQRDGGTYTRGAVVHATPWLSFTYNTSNNFQANDEARNVYGELLPNPEGQGSDYGVKLALFDRRLFFDLTYYTNASVNKIDGVSNTPAGNFKQFDQLWEGVANFTNDPKYTNAPYSNSGTIWSDSASSSSSGWEFSATANATKQWRLTLNGSKRSTSTTTARGVFIRQYMAEYLPIIKSHPEWQNLTTANNITVATRVADLETVLRNFEAIQNLPEDIYAPAWTLNIIQSYSFTRESRLAGFSLGGSMNARGRTIDGFAETTASVLNPNQPYYAPTYEIFGAWLTYQRKLFKNRVDWRLQLNVRNVFDAYTIFPLRAVDARDGNHTQATVIYRLSEPRTFTLTSAFKF